MQLQCRITTLTLVDIHFPPSPIPPFPLLRDPFGYSIGESIYEVLGLKLMFGVARGIVLGVAVVGG